MNRTLIIDSVKEVGKDVTLMGWVATRRDHGKIMFIDLRDRSGILQCVAVNCKENITTEDVVKIVGLVKERPAKMVNEKIPTGKVELEIKSIEILSKSRELPIPIDGDGYDINEESRLKYRYLDLRREA
jgi:aspartyl-tRNA synthetase